MNHTPTTVYPTEYSATHLLPISRAEQRKALGIVDTLPFAGQDLWTAFELSWLNSKGKPHVAIATISVPCTSPFLIESKSLKLYFNSFNQTRFDTTENVMERIQTDLDQATGSTVTLTLHDVSDTVTLTPPEGTCLDNLDVAITHYEITPELLTTTSEHAEESVYSHLLKSNCPLTGQPDWATIVIQYTGPQIHHAPLLQYLISFRNHGGFHEQCVERIFTDLRKQCRPTTLRVTARYTRRGGIDINPERYTPGQESALGILSRTPRQ